MSPTQESTVAQAKNTQTSSQDTLITLLDKAEGPEGTPALILAFRAFVRDIKPLPTKDKRITDAVCERLLAIY